jgi:amino acid adenylation domain-containing protein
MHHIVSDGWSLGVLTRELAALYEAFRRGRPSPLPEPELQYADYALWQRGWLQGEALEAQLAYWREKLSDAPAALELPTDRPRPPTASFRGASVRFAIPSGISNALSELARREGATLFMVLLAAFQTVLSRWSGQDDVVVGSPIAGRTHSRTENLIGFFVNTLALRTDLSGDPSFAELVRRVKETALGAYAHQDLPFEKLVAELAPVRDLSRQPVFQAMFTLQNTPQTRVELEGLTLTNLDSEGVPAKFDLKLSVSEPVEGLAASLDYAADLFEAATIQRMAEAFQRVLEQAVLEPQRRLSDLDLLSHAERRQVLVEWNNTAALEPVSRCLHELVSEQAEHTPEAVAVVYAGETLSYAELEARSNQWAHHLRTLGVGPEVVVGLCLERSLEMIVGLLGILKAGGAYLPLDPDHPPERLAFMLADASVPVIVTRSSLLPRLSELKAAVVQIDADAESITAHPTTPPDVETGPANLAYVIYTSGSTGRPKGVMARHQGLTNLSKGLKAHVGRLSERKLRATLNAPIIFDGSVKQLVQLADGHTLVVVPTDVRLHPQRMLDFIQREEIDLLDCVPTHLAQLQSEDVDGLLQGRMIWAGGEPLGAALRDRVAPTGATALYNVYGPTECTGVSALSPAAPGLSNPSVGGPLSNCRFYVLSSYLQPVPIGAPGELYIAGDGLARGYLARPGLTAASFLADPFGPAGTRMYRSGDLARWLANGELEILGRRDQQVKVRGHRIELGEIEAALLRHPDVAEAAVVAHETENAGTQLVAYSVRLSTGGVEAAALREHLRSSLPDYMVPQAFVGLDALPRLASGKLDRTALPKPEPDGGAAGRYTPPCTSTEEVVASIWREILRRDRVGVTEDFFQLGGHSLSGMQVISRICEVLEVELPLRALFETPTVRELSARVDASGKASAKPALGAELRPDPLPLSYAQERLWFLDRLGGAGAAYNMSEPCASRARWTWPRLKRR